MSDSYTNLIRSTRAYRHLSQKAQSGALSHAYILSGIDGDALRDIALTVVQLTLCPSLCGHCAGCRKVLGGNYADLRTYPADGRIKVADIEALVADAPIIPLEGSDKFYVLCDADGMTLAAQNKLLKTLEEPPQGVHIFICVNKIDALLPTVRSRSVKLNVPPFGRQAVVEVCRERFLEASEDEVQFAAALSGGSLRRAAALLSDDDLSDYSRFAAGLPEALQSSRDVVSIAAKLSGAGEPAFIIETLEIVYSKLLDMLALGQAATFGYNVAAVAATIELIIEANKRLTQNCAWANVLDNLLFGILEVKSKCR